MKKNVPLTTITSRGWVIGAKALNTLSAGLVIEKRVGFHTFRHTMATVMKDNGEDVKTIQEMLRHATTKVTLERYMQAASSAKRAARAKLVRMVIGDDRYSQLHPCGSS